MTTTAHPASPVHEVWCGTAVYTVDADNYCADLECWIYRTDDGDFVTIPND